MSDVERAGELLAAAHRDIAALRIMLDPADVADSIYGFHMQQAVEKSLKAWLAFHVGEFPFTHDLALLLGLLEDHADVSAYGDLIQYTPYAVQLRYDVFDADVPIDRQAALAESEALWASVQGLLKGPSKPASVLLQQPPEQSGRGDGAD